jgi:hypothetical protein
MDSGLGVEKFAEWSSEPGKDGTEVEVLAA